MNGENIFKILIATDNHVGYLEKDGIRGNDSFKTFEEILHLAQARKVDFLLLAGDLFHDNRPSMRCINEVLTLVRTYCLDDTPVQFELLCDPKKTFANSSFASVNYTDPNFNIGIPIFSIHGNHDDPAGPGNICALDLLHSCGFLNLFGKSNSVESLEVTPVLLCKGSTKLAIYGIGAMREERLHRLFTHDKVSFLRPENDSEGWFSLAAVHQNRVRHGPTGYLPESFLPDFLDLIIWGHEHDCRLEPEWNSSQNFYISQPGSSVATSLIEGEALPKAVGLLEICGREFKMTRLPLRTVRPFLFEDLILKEELEVDVNSLEASQRVEALCADRVLRAIQEASSDTSKALIAEGHEGQNTDGKASRIRLLPPPEPLIRLRVDTSGGFESFSSLRFGQKFVGRVANPKDLITFNRKRDRADLDAQDRLRTTSQIAESTGVSTDARSSSMGLSVGDVETLVSHILSTNEKLSLAIFTDAELAKGLRQFVDQSDNDGVKSVVDAIISTTQSHLKVHKCAEDRILAEVARYLVTRKRESVTKDAPVSMSVDEPLPVMISLEPSYAPTSQRVGIFDSASSEEECKDVDDEDVNSYDSRCAASRVSENTSGFYSLDNQSKSRQGISSHRSVAVPRRGGARGRRGNAASRRRGGASRSGLMQNSDDEDNVELEECAISFDFRRKRGRKI